MQDRLHNSHNSRLDCWKGDRAAMATARVVAKPRSRSTITSHHFNNTQMTKPTDRRPDWDHAGANATFRRTTVGPSLQSRSRLLQRKSGVGLTPVTKSKTARGWSHPDARLQRLLARIGRRRQASPAVGRTAVLTGAGGHCLVEEVVLVHVARCKTDTLRTSRPHFRRIHIRWNSASGGGSTRIGGWLTGTLLSSPFHPRQIPFHSISGVDRFRFTQRFGCH